MMKRLGKLIALRSSDVSPRVILDQLEDEVHELSSMYVVGLTKEGPVVYASGTIGDLAIAAHVLDIMAKRYLEEGISDD